MTIIVFLVDTSASMCQRAHVNGVQKTYLDIAKGAVETFLKFRQRSQDCMGDRYMLLTFEDPPNNVKAGWKENHATFMNELKNLQSHGLTSMGEALKNAFDLLNLNRMQSGIDTYGQGRCPFYLEPSVIIVLTDGGKYAFRNGVHQEIILPLHAQMPGTKLTKEPFRWDQRLFSLVLRMPGNRVEERADGKVPHDDSMIEKMCEVTGGRSYKIKSHYVLNQCIESLVQKVQPGVVIHFDQLITNNGESSTADLQFQSTKRMIYVPKQHPAQKTFPVGYWPIPEPYWPDPKLTSLPPRDAHPKIKIISPCCDEPQILRNFPIDKYELEASPLTLQILSKKESNKVWPLIVSTGMQGEMPFGYLKPNSTLPIVHLYVLPYNYQMLLPLINDLFHKFNLNPPNDWVYKFTNYVKTIPQYYCPFLRRALATTPNVPYQLVQYILPENLDSYLCPAVANYLKQMKNTAKQDQENLCMRVLKQLKQPKPTYHQLETVKVCTVPVQKTRDIVTHPMLKDTFTKMHEDIINYDNYTIVIPTITETATVKNHRNPYDIPRCDLIDEIARMREQFFCPIPTGISLTTKDSGHCLPISDMGNYQEYLKNKETPLRELEPTNVRQHMFGNPYKKDKNMVMVDEADLNDVAPMKSSVPHQSSHMKKNIEQGSSSRVTRKRKAGPIRKDYVFKRSALDVSSPSPCSAREGMHMLSDLSSEDENSSEFTSNSDNEDDTEGCLVMALDPSDSDLGEPIVFRSDTHVLKRFLQRHAEALLLDDLSDSHQALDDNQSSALGAPSHTSSPSQAEKVAAPIVSSESSSTSLITTPCLLPQSFQPPNVNQPGEDVSTNAGEAKLRRPQSPSSSICKQSRTAASDDAPNEPQVQDVAESQLLVRKRHLEHEDQPARSDGHSSEVDGFQSRKKPRIHQQEQPTKPKKISAQQHSESNEHHKRILPGDPTEALMPESSESLLLPLATKQDGTALSVHGLDSSRCNTSRQEMQGPHSDHHQLCTPQSLSSDYDDAETESSKHNLLVSTGASEPLLELHQQEQSIILEQPVRLEKNDEQLEPEGHDPDLESSKKQIEHIDQSKLRQTKFGKQQRQMEQPKQQFSVAAQVDQPDHEESHVTKTEPQYMVEEDTKLSEQVSTVLQHVPTVEPSNAALADNGQEQKQETQEPAIIVEQHNLSPRKPPQQTEIVFHQRPIQRDQPGSQWPLSNSSSSIVDVNSDMADVQKISNILKTCHNGGDEDRDKNREGQFEDSSILLIHDSGRARATPVAPTGSTESDTAIPLANGTMVATIVTNGRDGAIMQPTLNWDYNVALYSCIDDEDEQELERIEELNMKTRSIVFRDIRRPGRDYAELFKHLELMQGNRSCKKKFIDMCINEARRFRRHRMIDCIQQWWETHFGCRSIDDPTKLYFSSDTAVAAFQSDGFMAMPPSGGLYMNSEINSVYGAEFSHNNHHFAELVDEPFPSS